MSELSDLILSEESLESAIADGNDGLIAQWLNTPSIQSTRPIPIDEFIAELFRSGAFLAIQQAVLAGDETAVLAFETVKNAKALGLQNIDMSLAPNQALIAGLVQSGLITQAQADSVAALAEVTISPAENAGLGVVSIDQIARALRG